MSIKRILVRLSAALFIFSSLPGYTGDIISCDSFETCADGSVPVTNAILALEARMDALEAENTALKADNVTLKSDVATLQSELAANTHSRYTDAEASSAAITAIGPHSPDLTTEVATNTSAIAAIGPHSPDYSALLTGVSRIEDPNTLKDTLRFTNMNVQIVSGIGTTNGTPTGTGNLIIGYNELLGENDSRSGSHMLVLGARNNYSSSGGMVAGFQNTVSNLWASVSGGYQNTASAEGSFVVGGEFNTASGLNSSISGGQNNTASSDYASIGQDGQHAKYTDAEAIAAVGAHSPDYSALLAGVTRFNDQDNFNMDTLRFTNMNVQVVSGSGTTNGTPTGTGNLIIGYNEKRNIEEVEGDPDYRTGSHMLVVGRRNNYTSYGGMVVGERNTASAPLASVSGGGGNTASGSGSSVSGGVDNTANGNYTSVSGGSWNTASWFYTSVSGGTNNTASGGNASVSGGSGNTASAQSASVSGGNTKTASAAYCTVGDNGVDC